MEKLKYLFYVLICLTCIYSYGDTYMSANQAEKKFGIAEFNAEKFKTGDTKARGAMAADLLKKQFFVGKSIAEVRKSLGDPDGYFENKGILAYLISPDTQKGDIWQIVFLPSKNWKTVDEIKIHKNCCD